MQRRFKITVEGRQYEVLVEEVTEGVGSLYPDRGTMRAAAQSASVAAPVAAAPVASPPPAAAGEGDVVSPLSGVVQSIEVQIGAEVTAETRVVILEAMKTKTTVIAGRAGKVTAIAVTVGQGVEAGQVLISIA